MPGVSNEKPVENVSVNSTTRSPDALAGRTDQTMPVPETHFVNGHPHVGPWPDGMKTAMFAMGCFWGVERKFWQLDGVYSTFVGYAGGYTPNATYEEVCSGRTGHTEAVAVVYLSEWRENLPRL